LILLQSASSAKWFDGLTIKSKSNDLRMLKNIGTIEEE